MTDSSPSTETFGQAFHRLRRAQKNSTGAPLYSRVVNRPVGRIFAAAAYKVGLRPNHVTLISAAFTYAGIVTLAVADATWPTGIAVALLLMIGYALDSADGQLARLRGGGSALGEWLDHVIDSSKLATIHLAMLITIHRHFGLPSDLLLLVPMVFSAVQCVHFFGMILTDLVLREHHARTSPGVPFVASRVGGTHSTLVSIARLPIDYGALCIAMMLLGAHTLFFVIYTIMAVASAGYLLLGAARWSRQVSRTDQGGS